MKDIMGKTKQKREKMEEHSQYILEKSVTVHPRHLQYNRMYAPRTFYCHESRLRRSPLLRSSFLLIKWRSLRTFL